MKRVSLFDLTETAPAESLQVEFFKDASLKCILVKRVENTEENLRKVVTKVVGKSKIVIMRPSSPTSKIVDLLYYIEGPEGVEEEIASEIEGLGIAEEVVIIDLPNEKLALNVFFPILTLGERSIILRERIYSGFFNGLRERMGEGGAKAFLYLIGLNMGKKIAQSLHHLLGETDLIKCLKLLAFVGRAQGFFSIIEIEKGDDSISIDIRDNWEAACIAEKYRKKKPQCFWTKGVLKGILNELTSEVWNISETRCVAAGDDACRFTAKRSKGGENIIMP